MQTVTVKYNSTSEFFNLKKAFTEMNSGTLLKDNPIKQVCVFAIYPSQFMNTWRDFGTSFLRAGESFPKYQVRYKNGTLHKNIER